MKRRDLIKHLRQHGCEKLREGGNHTVFIHRDKRTSGVVPRHKEINDFLAKKICRDLDVPPAHK